jgi:hypothetical protein
MKYRLFDDGGDDQIFVMQSEGLGEPAVKEKNVFKFTGFSNEIHPYHKKQMSWVTNMLSLAGIMLNTKIVPTQDGISDDIDSGQVSADAIELPFNLKPSKDGNTYFLIHDKEMGRGWAVLMKIDPAGSREIITQEHRDSVRDWLLEGDFIRSFGIDYQKETVEDLSTIQ